MLRLCKVRCGSETRPLPSIPIFLNRHQTPYPIRCSGLSKTNSKKLLQQNNLQQADKPETARQNAVRTSYCVYNVKKQDAPYAWNASTVAHILDRWREYLGHTVNFKTTKKSCKSKKKLQNPKSEWVIFEPPQELIRTESIADAVRLTSKMREAVQPMLYRFSLTKRCFLIGTLCEGGV